MKSYVPTKSPGVAFRTSEKEGKNESNQIIAFHFFDVCCFHTSKQETMDRPTMKNPLSSPSSRNSSVSSAQEEDEEVMDVMNPSSHIIQEQQDQHYQETAESTLRRGEDSNEVLSDDPSQPKGHIASSVMLMLTRGGGSGDGQAASMTRKRSWEEIVDEALRCSESSGLVPMTTASSAPTAQIQGQPYPLPRSSFLRFNSSTSIQVPPNDGSNRDESDTNPSSNSGEGNDDAPRGDNPSEEAGPSACPTKQGSEEKTSPA